MDKLTSWIWLTNLHGIGSIKITKLMQEFDSIEDVWNASPNDFKYVEGLSANDIAVLGNKNTSEAKNIILNMKKLGINALTIDDPHYPNRLKDIYDPPRVLYIRGELPEEGFDIAVVGSRQASTYGRMMAEKLSFQLAEQGVMIVSGMAKGIDTFAHKGALKAGQRTIAVLGCGVDITYPKENEELMRYIIKNGAVISEYAPGTQPHPGYFPARNRIISGMSLGTIVIEAGEKSGSLITADFALEQGREVFAVPGNINSWGSKGVNNLIKQGAKLVSGLEDILEEFPGYISIQKDKVITDDTMQHIEDSRGQNQSKMTDDENSMYLKLSQEERIIISHLSAMPIHIDELYKKTGCSIQQLSAILTVLEMQGIVTQLPGKCFIV